MRVTRLGLSKDRLAASTLAGAAAPLTSWPNDFVVAGYAAMGAELDPTPLLERLTARGARVVLPVVIARSAPLIFREAGLSSAYQPDAAGIGAPPPWAQALRPDLILAPLLAFDRFGGRLGQGGGYYDRTIRALRAAGPLQVVGFAFAGQEVERVPMDEQDERLDAILTEKGYSEL